MNELNSSATYMAVRNFKENVYDFTKFENINVTFPETEKVLDGAKVANLDEFEVKTILGLKRGWSKVIYPMEGESYKNISLSLLKEVNKLVGDGLVLEPGELRKKPVGVSGVKGDIDALSQKEWEANIEEFNKIKSPLLRALTFLIFSITNQPFADGNKRSSFLAANAVLIANNVGVLSIKPDKMGEFNDALHEYYNDKSISNEASLLLVLLDNLDVTNEYEKEAQLLSKQIKVIADAKEYSKDSKSQVLIDKLKNI